MHHQLENIADHLRIGRNSPSSSRTPVSVKSLADTDFNSLCQAEFDHLEILNLDCGDIDVDDMSHSAHESFAFLRLSLDFPTQSESVLLNTVRPEEPGPRTFIHVLAYPPSFDLETSPPPPPRRFYRTFWRSIVRRAVQRNALGT
jgi:hypothetical protein